MIQNAQIGTEKLVAKSSNSEWRDLERECVHEADLLIKVCLTSVICRRIHRIYR